MTTRTQEIPMYTPVNPLAMVGAVIAYAVRGLIGAYGLSITGYLILHFLIGEERAVLIGVFNSFLHLLVPPALVLLPLSVLLRRRELVALTCLPFVVALWWYAPVFLNAAPGVPDDTTRLTVVTHNILAQRNEPSTVIATVREMDADLVLFQELNRTIATAISDELAESYPYQALSPHDNGIFGQGIISRYPIVEQATWTPYRYYQQRAVVDVQGTHIAVYNAHLTFPFGDARLNQRRGDTEQLIARARAETIPVIVGGDFNLTEHHDDYDRLTAHFTDAYRQAARQFGWTYAPFAGVALARIDYVMHSDDFTATSARVWSHPGGSDHYPVWTELALLDD